MEIRFLNVAQQELDESFEFYEEQITGFELRAMCYL